MPIFLLTHGLSLQAVFTYSLLVFVSTFLSLLVALKSNQYLGMKKTLLLGILLTIIFYISLRSFINGFNFKLIALIDGMSLGFYFGAYNMLLTKALKRSREGKGTGVQQIAGIIAGVIGPTLGALIIKRLFFQDLFLGVIILLILAPLPLFFSKELHAKHQSLELGRLFTRRPGRADRAIFLQGVMYGSGTFWPVYIYIHYPHLTALGLLATVTSGLTIIVTYIIGSSIDKRQRLAYRLGGLLYAPTWISRLLFLTPIGLGINTLLATILAVGPTMAVSKDIFHIAKTTRNQSSHFTRVEFYMDAGRAGLFAVAVIIPHLTVVFILTSICAFLYIGCAPRKKRTKLTLHQIAT